jgi:hypothetical protein
MNLRNGIYIILFFAFNQASAQKKPKPPETSVEQMAYFPGGEAAFINYFNKIFSYDWPGAGDRISGTVVALFVIDKNGKVEEVKLLRDIGQGYGCGAEVLRVLKKMPKWNPGIKNSKPQCVEGIVLIRFMEEVIHGHDGPDTFTGHIVVSGFEELKFMKED